MLEIRITAPELSEAINNLAKALASNQCECGHTVCHQHGENNAHIDNVGTINVDAQATLPADSTANPIVPVSAPQSVHTAPNAQNVNTPAPEAPIVPTTAVPTASDVSIAPATPTAAVPTSAPQYTLDMIAKAGASLIDAGKIAEVQALLGKYGVDAIVSLNPSMYGAIATDLRAMGAQI